VTDQPRLIEHAFPLKQASLDSVHEKNVRHGHISTLHIWPARRPLAACRAALIATLLPDPGTPEKRKELCEKIGGKVVKKIERKKMPNGQIVEREKEVTEGGILHWGRETENKELLDWFRGEIRKAYGGRAPKVLDPFAGGGAIPLEAMRLGCEATAIDINPVAWFILKCTLEYPQKLAGKTWPLPDFILENEEFMEGFYKAHPHLIGRTKKTQKQKDIPTFNFSKTTSDRAPKADLAWHVRAWGQWVLNKARRELARYYPVYADFEGLDPRLLVPYEKQTMRLVPLKDDGTPNVDELNKDFSKNYLANKGNPRWVAKPTIAYLWARTVKCKNCRSTISLLKTRWLCKKEKRRVLLTIKVIGQEVGQKVGQASLPANEFPAIDPLGQAQRLVPPTIKDIFTIYRRKLPHWRLEGSTYFLTCRLHRNQADLKPEERSLVASALRHFEGSRYKLLAYVVLNDHVHVLVEPLSGHTLTKITHAWKSFTAHELQREFGRQGVIWQDESFDRIVRDESELQEKAQYIQDNPLKRWPEIRDYPWVGFPQWEILTTSQDQRLTNTGMADTGMTGTEACPTIPKVVFGIESNVPVKGGNTAQRRENDKRIGGGTMSRSGAKCPCCSAIMTMEDIRLEGRSGRLGEVMTTVVVDGQKGKEYRLPVDHEIEMAVEAERVLPTLFAEIPFGLPEEPLPSKEALGFRVPLYGFDRWQKLFTSRQLLALGTFVKCTRAAREEQANQGWSLEWVRGVSAYLGLVVSKSLDYNSMLATWNLSTSATAHGFTRWALPITWDFTEANIIEGFSGGYSTMLEWLQISLVNVLKAHSHSPLPSVRNQSASTAGGEIDAIVTDPPYYDAIPYSDLMDFFYVWLRRILNGLSPELDSAFKEPLSPKWIHEQNDGELIDDPSRHEGDKVRSKAVYEDGMARVFQACHNVLNPEGKLVVVFANKQPEAWETLVSALIRSGFVVDGSWPIQTEREARTRALSSAALASSVWLVCKKRPAMARPGWDNQVLEDMRQNVREKLREFWDAGIRGPDFVWAATGPALEAYSKHPIVKKANDPGQVMAVSEFLAQVRRIVVDFVVGRVLSGSDVSSLEEDDTRRDVASTLDEPTAYYLLHRHDFGLDEAPAGACILYAISCGLSDRELAATWDLISFTKGKSGEGENGEDTVDADAEADTDVEEDSGSKVKLKTWVQRKSRSLGYEAPGGKPIPLIDRVHCLMHIWKGQDLHKVEEYLDENGLRRQELFKRLLQSLIELSPHGSEERSLLESLSNHIQARGATKERDPHLFPVQSKEE
jgi:adenine-specific DNA methylase/REP element-mobilizing transposase RayT